MWRLRHTIWSFYWRHGASAKQLDLRTQLTQNPHSGGAYDHLETQMYAVDRGRDSRSRKKNPWEESIRPRRRGGGTGGQPFQDTALPQRCADPAMCCGEWEACVKKGRAHCTTNKLGQSLLWQMGPSEEGQWCRGQSVTVGWGARAVQRGSVWSGQPPRGMDKGWMGCSTGPVGQVQCVLLAHRQKPCSRTLAT